MYTILILVQKVYMYVSLFSLLFPFPSPLPPHRLSPQTMAWIFDGFQLYNCHNIPIEVSEALLDSAREVNPQLYVTAELFARSEENENYFVNRLGINSVVRGE